MQSCSLAIVLVSIGILAQTPPSPCPAERPIDDIIAELHRQGQWEPRPIAAPYRKQEVEEHDTYNDDPESWAGQEVKESTSKWTVKELSGTPELTEVETQPFAEIDLTDVLYQVA